MESEKKRRQKPEARTGGKNRRHKAIRRNRTQKLASQVRGATLALFGLMQTSEV